MTTPAPTTPPKKSAAPTNEPDPGKVTAANDAIVVEVRTAPNQRDWHGNTGQTSTRTAIVPATNSNTQRIPGGSAGAIQRFAQRAARADPNSSVTLSRFGKIAGSLGALSSQASVGIGVTSTNRNNNQALTAIGIATVWAQWGHRTLLVNADPARGRLTKALQQTKPSLGDLIQALNEGKTLALPQTLTSELDDLEAISGIGNYSLAQLGETGVLQKLDFAFRTRYDRIVWALPPLNRQVWSPIVIHQVVDSIVISAKRGRTDLRLVEALSEEMTHADWPPLQVTWHE